MGNKSHDTRFSIFYLFSQKQHPRGYLMSANVTEEVGTPQFPRSRGKRLRPGGCLLTCSPRGLALPEMSLSSGHDLPRLGSVWRNGCRQAGLQALSRTRVSASRGVQLAGGCCARRGVCLDPQRQQQMFNGLPHTTPVWAAAPRRQHVDGAGWPQRGLLARTGHACHAQFLSEMTSHRGSHVCAQSFTEPQKHSQK